MEDSDIDLSDIPEISEDQMMQAKLRFDGKPMPKSKIRVNILLDADIVAFFKTHAGGKGYQTLINEALRKSIRTEDLETMLRRTIRDELKAIT